MSDTPDTKTLIARYEAEQRAQLLTKSKEELVDIIMQLYEDLDVANREITKAQLTSARLTDETARLKCLTKETLDG